MSTTTRSGSPAPRARRDACTGVDVRRSRGHHTPTAKPSRRRSLDELQAGDCEMESVDQLDRVLGIDAVECCRANPSHGSCQYSRPGAWTGTSPSWRSTSTASPHRARDHGRTSGGRITNLHGRMRCPATSKRSERGQVEGRKRAACSERAPLRAERQRARSNPAAAWVVLILAGWLICGGRAIYRERLP